MTGTTRTDTVCEPCAEGSFSSSFSKVGECAPHQQCALGDAVILNGSVYHDTVCGTCLDFASGGQFHVCVIDFRFNSNRCYNCVIHLLDTGETYRRVLSGVFSTQRIRISQMKKFVFRWVYYVSCGFVIWSWFCSRGRWDPVGWKHGITVFFSFDSNRFSHCYVIFYPIGSSTRGMSAKTLYPEPKVLFWIRSKAGWPRLHGTSWWGCQRDCEKRSYVLFQKR